MAERRAAEAVARSMTPEGAAALAAELGGALPPSIAPLFDASFVRSSALYEAFVHRLVLGVVREAGLEAPLREGGDPGDLIARAGLDPARAAVPVLWLLRHLAAHGTVELDGARGGAPRARLRQALPVLDPAPLREAQEAHDPSWRPAYVLAETVARDYPAFLRGRTPGEAVLFSPARFRLWIEYFSNANGLYAVNNHVGARALLAWLPPGGGPVVELGGGLGSAAVAATEAFERAGRLAELTGYRFTELVPAFLRRGQSVLEARWPDARWLACAPLDMNRPFAEQGVPPESAACVYAVNTVHVAHDLVATLDQARRALRPGGRLVLAECVRPFPGQAIYAEFIFNLMEAFRTPRLHPVYRPNGGFLTPEQWAGALEAAGFTDVRYLPDLPRLRERFPMFYVAAIGATRPG